MNSVKLLDCTLRDGGLVNDWNFGIGSIKSIINRLNLAGIDIIEVGFIDERRSRDENRSIFPDTDAILPVFRNIDSPKATIVGMIDYGTCSIDKVTRQDTSYLDGIRVIFRKKDQDEAIAFLLQIKEKGYKIFVNSVSICRGERGIGEISSQRFLYPPSNELLESRKFSKFSGI